MQTIDDASAVDAAALRDGMITWATVDAPWLSVVDRDLFNRKLAGIAALEPSAVLSSHLPPATGMTETLLDCLAAAPSAPVFMGPDQAAMEKMLAGV